MADAPDVEAIRKEFEKQVADLKKEVAKLSKSVAKQGGEFYDDIRDDAEDLYDTVSQQARGAARQVRRQAHVVSEAARENPGTAATVLSSAGIVGFLIGLVVGQALSAGNSRRWY